jgi:hypothetical protein
MEKKKCSKCLKSKYINNFYTDKSKRSGYKSQCKECCTKPKTLESKLESFILENAVQMSEQELLNLVSLSYHRAKNSLQKGKFKISSSIICGADLETKIVILKSNLILYIAKEKNYVCTDLKICKSSSYELDMSIHIVLPEGITMSNSELVALVKTINAKV